MTQALPTRLRRGKRDRTLVTPEGITLPITVASRGSRAGALILDLIIIVLLQVVTTLALIWIAFGSLNASNFEGLSALEFLFVVWVIIMFLFRNAYFLFFELGARGATPGKRLAGIRIAARDGGRLSVEMVVARNLLRDIELFLPIGMLFSAFDSENSGMVSLAALAWFLIFMLFPFFNRDRLRAGDVIAGSWVVETPRRKLEAAMTATDGEDRPMAAPTSAIEFSDEELAVYGEYELQTLERVLREDRTESLAKVHEAIAAKIGRHPYDAESRPFLEAYYRQLRARLETGMRMGQRKADKFSG
ncbi:MAG: RDD family protein [Sphingomonadaceae bacterium]